MAFSLIRLCRRHPWKCLSNEYFSVESSFTSHKIFSRQNCLKQFSTECRSFSKTGFKGTHQKCSSVLYDSLCQKNFSDISVRRVTSCPLRAFFPSDVQIDPKLFVKLYSTSSSSESPPPELSNKEKLKRAVKEYGTTVIIFHVTISLISLGSCYLAVSSGLNIGELIGGAGLNNSSEIANEAGLFVVAYAVHKVLAPFRIAITLAATPIIVRYLRKINVLKPPKPVSKN